MKTAQDIQAKIEDCREALFILANMIGKSSVEHAQEDAEMAKVFLDSLVGWRKELLETRGY